MLSIANELLQKIGFNQPIKTLSQCDDKFFIGIYEQILDEDLPGKLFITPDII